jgi:hypothetical protein
VLVVPEIIFQDEQDLAVLNVLVLNERFGCGAFVFSCGFVLSKGPNRPKFGVHTPSQTFVIHA